MLTRIAFRSASKRNWPRAAAFLFAGLLIAFGGFLFELDHHSPQSAQAGDQRRFRAQSSDSWDDWDAPAAQKPPAADGEPVKRVRNRKAEETIDDDEPVKRTRSPQAVKTANAADSFDGDAPVKRVRNRQADDSADNEEPIKRVRNTQLGGFTGDNEVVDPDAPVRRIRAPRPAYVDPDENSVDFVGNGIGMMGRGGFLAGRTFGRRDSIAPLEAMPYILTDEHFIFADVRGFATTRSQTGGNFGLGYRRLFDNYNAWGGASIWYDADRSTGQTFDQVGLSFEGLIRQFEFRSNVYLPFNTSQNLSNSISNSQIVGNQLLYSRTMIASTALRGVDAEVGYSLPVMDRHVVRGYVGGYHFEGGTNGSVNGFKARVEGVINNTITAQALYTNDKLYGSNLMVGLSMQFPFGDSHPSSGWERNTPSPFRFVERNYNVIVDQSQSTLNDQVATDPNTGNPYLVEQVYAPSTPVAPSGTPDGTAAHPFSSIAAAQAAGGNIIIVQSGSVIDQPVTLASGQHLFGQGNYNASVATTGGGYVPIPNLLAAGASPIIQNVNGDAVTLASNSEIAGFNITSPTGNGITGSGVSGVSIHDLVFSSIGGDAINLANSSGTINMSNIQINSATGNGIVFNGGTPNITFAGGGDTITAQGNGFVLENLTGGTSSISGLSLQNIGGTGLLIDSVASNLNFNSLTVNQSGTSGPGFSGVSITGTSGKTYKFTGATSITAPSGTGLSITNTDATVNVANLNVNTTSNSTAVTLANDTSPITFGSLNATTQNSEGLSVNTVSNLTINGGVLSTMNGPAIDVESSAINATFNSVSADGGAFGIKLASSTGSFTIVGGSGFSTGGTIQNMTTAGMLINSFGNTTVSSVDFVNNAVGIQSTGSSSINLTSLRITGSTGYAIDSLNDQVFILSTSTLDTNGAAGGGTVRVQVNTTGTFASLIQENTITDNNGTAIQLLTSGGGAGAGLETQITNNSIFGYHNGSSLLNMNWNGPVSANIGNNTFEAFGTNMTAIMLQDSSLTGNFVAAITTNTIDFETAAATNGTAIYAINGQSGQTGTGTATFSVLSNAVVFQGTGGTGMRFAQYNTGSDTVESNTIVDQAGSATGVLFDYSAAGTNALFTANSINLLASTQATNRGFVFTNTQPTLTFYTITGAASNGVSNTTSSNVFIVPTGTATGGILINNSLIQPH